MCHREPPVGFEPTTTRLRIESSTPELRWQFFNALERTRTAMPFGTTPSRWRVYQFHHQGKTPQLLAGCFKLFAYGFFIFQQLAANR